MLQFDAVTYGDRLRLLREMAGLSREEVGLALGFSESSARNIIGRWERGERLPRVQYLRPLVLLYHVSTSDILPMPPATPDREHERNYSPPY